MTDNKKKSLVGSLSLDPWLSSLLLLVTFISSIAFIKVNSDRGSGNIHTSYSGGGGDFDSGGGGADFNGDNPTSGSNLDVEQSREYTDSLLAYLPAINEQKEEPSLFVPVETASFFSGVAIATLIGLLRYRIDKSIHSQYEKTDQVDRE